MNDRLKITAQGMAGAALLIALYAGALRYPAATGATLAMAMLAGLLFALWHDPPHKSRRYVRWRHRDVLEAAAVITAPHLDALAAEMAQRLRWDGRWDYDFTAWAPFSRSFVTTQVIPSLPPALHQRVVRAGPALVAEIESGLTGRVFSHAQKQGLLQ